MSPRPPRRTHRSKRSPPSLSLIIEILASILVSNLLVSVVLSIGGDPGGNGLVAALDPSAFGDQFLFNVERLRAAIKSLPPSSGVDSVYLPGERGFEAMERRSRSGIPVVRGTISRLLTLASRLNVSVPDSVADQE